jgi:hypothetical protein
VTVAYTWAPAGTIVVVTPLVWSSTSSVASEIGLPPPLREAQ